MQEDDEARKRKRAQEEEAKERKPQRTLAQELRELIEMKKEGILTDEESKAAKAAAIRKNS